MTVETFWLGIGFLSQALFAARFLIQWIASERRKISYIPKIFWYFSIAGSVGLLFYAGYRKDPVFFLGQSVALLIYLRNLTMVHSVK